MNNNSGSRGIGFCGCLCLLFIALKLMNVIKWSWLLVLAPIWVPTAILVASFILWAIIKFACAIFKKSPKEVKK